MGAPGSSSESLSTGGSTAESDQPDLTDLVLRMDGVGVRRSGSMLLREVNWAVELDERWVVLSVIGLALWATGVGVLWIVGGVALYHTIRGEAGPGHRATAVTFAGLVLALSWLARAVG